MAFDYGSLDLGIKNPFKKEGLWMSIRGALQVLAAVLLLFLGASKVKHDAISGWVFVIVGAVILVAGIRALSAGIFAQLRFFVGRNHPTSLAYNFSKSETSTAAEERTELAYNANILEEMLMGRKNPTFLEPSGFLARLLHSFFPRLLYMPYPLRNEAQLLCSAWVSTLTVLLSYTIVAFICLNGFAGLWGEKLFPMYSGVALVYILLLWRMASSQVSRQSQNSVASLAGASIAKTIVLSIVLPIIIGLLLSFALEFLQRSGSATTAQFLSFSDLLWQNLPGFSPFLYIIGIIIFAAVCSVPIILLLRERTAIVHPVTEVSELRENWQESVHPKEIFINLDNLVMANRRYKEVPNRVYRELEPNLEEQVNGKGSFAGEMIQETQPAARAVNLGALFVKIRNIALYTSNILFVLATLFSVWMAFAAIKLLKLMQSQNLAAVGSEYHTLQDNISAATLGFIHDFGNQGMSLLHIILWAFIIKTFAQLLANAVHLFFAEIQFDSLLVYFKCEGTFTESKISTGASIHDSTRSENVLVRSSITPWVIATKIVSTTFAASGMRNLEYPRYVLEMHKTETELAAIREDVIKFLKDRESIASITSTRDLQNTANIHSINQQSRAIPTYENNQIAKDEQAAGFLRNQTPDIE